MSRHKPLPSDNELINFARAYSDIKHIRTDNILLYDRIIRGGLSKAAFSHMPNRSIRSDEIDGGWTIDKFQEEIRKYEFLCDFRNKSQNAYAAIIRRKLKYLLTGLKRGQIIRTGEDLYRDALLCKSRKEFKIKYPLSYQVALRRGKEFFDKLCFHMKRPKVSLQEKTILEAVLALFPNAKKKLYTKISISGRPYISALEIDVYVPELKKGIEYDSKWYHSEEGLIRSHPTWPPEEAKKYHEIKDEYFLSKGIKILHIREEEWDENKEDCIKRCLEFLGA